MGLKWVKYLCLFTGRRKSNIVGDRFDAQVYALVCDPLLIRTHTYYIGSQDGAVHVWLADTGEKVAVLDGGHPGPTHCCQFNPKLMMMATACSSTVGCDSHVIVM